MIPGCHISVASSPLRSLFVFLRMVFFLSVVGKFIMKFDQIRERFS